MINKKTEVAIVGGGVIGMLTARVLVEAGLQVCLLEKSQIAQESTWAGGGILTPLYPWRYPHAVNTLAFRSLLLYPEIAAALQAISGVDPEYIQSGLLMDERDVNEEGYQWLKENHQSYERTTAQAQGLIDVPGDFHYLKFPQICQVRNPRFASALQQTILSLGVDIQTNCLVQDITSGESGFRIHTQSGEVRADKVIVCAGAWSGKLLAESGLELLVKPMRGQMLLFKAVPSLLQSIILSQGKYIIPRKDGRILVGSTMEDVGFDKNTTQAAREELINFIDEVLPALNQYPIEEHWSGLRPASPDGTPFICQHPKIDNLFINSGHFRNGFILGPASAELMADLLLNNTPKIDPTPYQL